MLVFAIKANSVDSTYTLTVSRGLTILKEKEAFTDSIGRSGDYRFYEYYRPCDRCTTVFSINALSNDQYTLFVNFNTTDKIARHSDMKSSDFVLQGRGSQELKITTEDLIAAGYKDQPGYFLVEVHSHSTINYTISGSTNKGAITSITQGIWVEYVLKNDSLSKTYAYKHNSENSFYISTMSTYGYIDVVVNVVPEDYKGDLVNYIPTREKHDWPENWFYDYVNHEILNTSQKFCKTCYYLISINAWSMSTGEIAIQELGVSTNKNQMTNLKLGKPIKLDMGDTTYAQYKFIVPSEEAILLDFNVLYGNMDYKLTNYAINTDEYANLFDMRTKGYIHGGWQGEGVFVFDKSNKYFEVGKTFYLSVKSYQTL